MPQKVVNVNCRDIKKTIELGCNPMYNVFNRNDNDMPFFEAIAYPEGHFNFCGFATESHIPGRHINALLTAEAITGVSLDESAVKKHQKAAFFSFSGPVVLPLNREKIDGELVNFYPHNIREGIHALYALTKYRNSEEAQKLGESCINTILRYWSSDKGWKKKTIEAQFNIKVHLGDSFINGLARALGALVKFYQFTSYPQALELVIKIKDKLLKEYFKPSGVYDPQLFGVHSHSITCTMSSLAQTAVMLSDLSIMERVKAFYDNGLKALRDEIGWSIENARDMIYTESDCFRHPGRGEVNNTGDIVETTLILGQTGYAECYGDAERILRAHLLPSQLRDTSFIRELNNPDHQDYLREPAKRMLGGFGFPAPYGHRPAGMPLIRFNMDIVGGVIGSLCEAYKHIAFYNNGEHWVNMLFDHETPYLKIQSPYTNPFLEMDNFGANLTFFNPISSWNSSEGEI